MFFSGKIFGFQLSLNRTSHQKKIHLLISLNISEHSSSLVMTLYCTAVLVITAVSALSLEIIIYINFWFTYNFVFRLFYIITDWWVGDAVLWDSHASTTSVVSFAFLIPSNILFTSSFSRFFWYCLLVSSPELFNTNDIFDSQACSFNIKYIRCDYSPIKCFIPTLWPDHIHKAFNNFIS